MDTETVGREHPFLMCVQKGVASANGMKADGKEESQSGLPKGRWSIAKPMCISHIFSVRQRISSPSKLAVSQLWRWAEGEGWAASTFPSRWWEGAYRLFALFSWWVEAWQHRDGRMLSIALPGNFTRCQGKPE